MVFAVTVCVIPIAIVLGFWYFGGREITLREFLFHFLFTLVFCSASIYLSYQSMLWDTAVLNGRVTGKKQVRVSCSHSYSCNCRTVTSRVGKTTSSRVVCSTCYEHSNDWDWRVYTSVGDLNIARVDRRGSNMPARWDQVVIGEPASLTESYTNYIKGSPDTLFRDHGNLELFQTRLPEYPGKIYDYYRIRRVVQVGGSILSPQRYQAWENRLSELNASLGLVRECNILIVLVKEFDREFVKALSYSWLGGKKNDIIVAMGVNPDPDVPEIRWAEVVAWSTTSELAVNLRDSLENLGKAFMPEVFNRIEDNVRSYYRRKPMEDFKYLYQNVSPGMLHWFVTVFVNALVCVGVGMVLLRNNEREAR